MPVRLWYFLGQVHEPPFFQPSIHLWNGLDLWQALQFFRYAGQRPCFWQYIQNSIDVKSRVQILGHTCKMLTGCFLSLRILNPDMFYLYNISVSKHLSGVPLKWLDKLSALFTLIPTLLPFAFPRLSLWILEVVSNHLLLTSRHYPFGKWVVSFKASLYKNIFYFQDGLCGRQIITFLKHLGFTATFTAAVCESLHKNVWRKVVSLLIQCLLRKNNLFFVVLWEAEVPYVVRWDWNFQCV